MPYNIPLPTAAEMKLHYSQNKELILAPAFQNKNILPLSETFVRPVIETVPHHFE